MLCRSSSVQNFSIVPSGSIATFSFFPVSGSVSSLNIVPLGNSIFPHCFYLFCNGFLFKKLALFFDYYIIFNEYIQW